MLVVQIDLSPLFAEYSLFPQQLPSSSASRAKLAHTQHKNNNTAERYQRNPSSLATTLLPPPPATAYINIRNILLFLVITTRLVRSFPYDKNICRCQKVIKRSSEKVTKQSSKLHHAHSIIVQLGCATRPSSQISWFVFNNQPCFCVVHAVHLHLQEIQII